MEKGQWEMIIFSVYLSKSQTSLFGMEIIFSWNKRIIVHSNSTDEGREKERRGIEMSTQNIKDTWSGEDLCPQKLGGDENGWVGKGNKKADRWDEKQRLG